VCVHVCVCCVVSAPCGNDYQARHLARHYAADLFLDAFAYGAHTTASDGLSSGLPMVVLQGASFAARVSSSILKYADLDHLVTHSVRDFVDVASRLAGSPEVCAVVVGHGHTSFVVRGTSFLFLPLSFFFFSPFFPPLFFLLPFFPCSFCCI
jgi:hypothetical protein